MSDAPAFGPVCHILGLPFFAGPLDAAVAAAWQGAMIVAPSGPNLANELLHSPAYREAVQQADLRLADSAVMVAMHWLATGAAGPPRHSGLTFLRRLLESGMEDPRVFWILPSAAEAAPIRAWLGAQGWPCDAANSYIAPQYPAGAIKDEVLLQRLQAFQPRLVFVNLAGGKQEVLAAWLRPRLGGTTGWVCTGAAIGFLAGTQAAIPAWADQAGLGWLLRCLTQPGKFVPRYWSALPLLSLVARYRDRLPPATR